MPVGLILFTTSQRPSAGACARSQPAGSPRPSVVRIDAVAVVVDDRDQLVSLEQFEDVA